MHTNMNEEQTIFDVVERYNLGDDFENKLSRLISLKIRNTSWELTEQELNELNDLNDWFIWGSWRRIKSE